MTFPAPGGFLSHGVLPCPTECSTTCLLLDVFDPSHIFTRPQSHRYCTVGGVFFISLEPRNFLSFLLRVVLSWPIVKMVLDYRYPQFLLVGDSIVQ